jgi:hypothetical protein
MAMQPVDHLVAAVLAKDDTRILTLLGQDPDLAVARNMFGVSAVHAAHYTGATRLLSLLLPSEVDVFLAAELGAVEDVRRAVRAEPAVASRFDGRGAPRSTVPATGASAPWPRCCSAPVPTRTRRPVTSSCR